MEYVYAAMMLHKAGKKITEDLVKSVLSAGGVQVEEARVKALVAALEGVNIDEAIEKAAVVAAPVAVVPVAGNEAPVKEKEEKKDDKKAEQAAAAGLGALFG